MKNNKQNRQNLPYVSYINFLCINGKNKIGGIEMQKSLSMW